LRGRRAAVAADVVLRFGLDRDELLVRKEHKGRWLANGSAYLDGEANEGREGRTKEHRQWDEANVPWTSFRDQPPTWPWTPSSATIASNGCRNLTRGGGRIDKKEAFLVLLNDRWRACSTR
jgi:hypothetical protein